jgi:hypothetical protein
MVRLESTQYEVFVGEGDGQNEEEKGFGEREESDVRKEEGKG